MAHGGLRREEKVGLAVAAGLHVALLAVLLLQPSTREAIPQPQRMTVSLATDVGMDSTAPEPVPESRAAQAPTLAEEQAPAPPVERAMPEPVERPVPTVEKPRPRASASPKPKATARPKDTSRDQRQQTTPPKKAGGSRLGDNFLEGAGDSTRTSETRIPASRIGASAKASIIQAVGRQIKPHWSPPNGPEVEKIVSFVKFRLNPDGSLAGRPELVRQTGVNDTNRAQAGRHGEQAIRAVQLAAPFDLPAEYYEAWKVVTANLDWRLAQ